MFKRCTQILVLVCAAFTMLGAGSPSTRFDRIGHKLMCTCGCAEILLECNHMGCPDSPGLIAALNEHLQGSESDASILHWFASHYGATVLAAPIRGGFDVVAWIMPFAILAFGMIGVFWLLRHWQDRHRRANTTLPAPFTGDPQAGQRNALHERIRRETTFEP